jgi:hypothetical protein
VGLGEAIVNLSAILGGLTIIGAAAWRWVVKPAFTSEVGKIVDARTAAALKPIIEELSFNSGKSLKDVVIRIDQRIEDHVEFHRRGD